MSFLFKIFGPNQSAIRRATRMKKLYEYCCNLHTNIKIKNIASTGIDAFAYGFNEDCDKLLDSFERFTAKKSSNRRFRRKR